MDFLPRRHEAGLEVLKRVEKSGISDFTFVE
jgi:hypothetical protein